MHTYRQTDTENVILLGIHTMYDHTQGDVYTNFKKMFQIVAVDL